MSDRALTVPRIMFGPMARDANATGAGVILILLRRKGEPTKEDNALLTVGLALVVIGIIVGDERLIGYSFIGVRVLLSIMSAIRNRAKTVGDSSS